MGTPAWALPAQDYAVIVVRRSHVWRGRSASHQVTWGCSLWRKEGYWPSQAVPAFRMEADPVQWYLRHGRSVLHWERSFKYEPTRNRQDQPS